jgi:putative hydrolase of the HAD superfamily
MLRHTSPYQPATILFDLDGTLLDDGRATDAAVESLHSAHGDALGMSLADLTGRWKKLLSIHYARYLAGEISMQEQRRARVRDLFGATRRLEDEGADEIFAVYERAYRASWAAFPDVLPALSALGGYKLAVLTNGDLSQQRQKLQATGLDAHVPDIFASSVLGFAKPQPEAFRLACTNLGVDPKRCLFVGDDLHADAHGSASAGLRSIWLDRRRSGHIPSQSIRVIHTLADLPALVLAETEGEAGS